LAFAVLLILSSKAKPSEVTMSLEAWEDQSPGASCPWVYAWNGAEFVKDNDVYSTARGSERAFRDFYTLNVSPVPEQGQYLLDLRETENEFSFTDFVQLITVDHAADVRIAADDVGNVWTYGDPRAPETAVDNQGGDLLAALASMDGVGFNAYHEDFAILDFGNLDTSGGATLVLRVQGFLVAEGDTAGAETFARPYVHVQTLDASGNWVTRHEFHPRWEYATAAYDLSTYLTINKLVRLLVTSCHTGKYHTIDYVGLDTSAQAPATVSVLSPTSAMHSSAGDVLSAIEVPDGIYAFMTTSEQISLTFPVPALSDDRRDFVLVTEGYYVPQGTYYVHTWNGSQWVMRDSWSVQGNGDQLHDFDLSPWLPDPDDEYKVRISQNSPVGSL
jgi:hypothetical protein